MASLPPEFDASPWVQDWIKNASAGERDALTALLTVLKDHYLPGGSLLPITSHTDPFEIPASYNVLFDDCLLTYQVPMRADEPIKLVVITAFG